MRVVVQRVKQASVSVEDGVIGQIGVGLLVLAGFEAADQPADAHWMAQKLVKLRVFSDEQDVMNCSVADIGGDILAVSQFTLYASTKKGNRPSWGRAAAGDISRPLFDAFVDQVSLALGRPVPTGAFGANMQVSLVNDGPVTIAIDSRNPE
ncbi:D-aminoacyl-tRNA deacylase [Georgfuchsia toluolica]|uniref:D-aminoacyl-tRNA deacylase n=1 Tax=Georgfuchsia toluolica TaxID=424218 RepID=A0A916J2C0_9PROT|nr:D-aminoacyl-tRNA deacylase [Georgfuchsia toluolica]CAG4882673.1 D-aminoacyl-tRNA deacylase [Georgfuchsia toluolica]